MSVRFLLPYVMSVSLLLLTACDPAPVQRPREGAPVGGTPSGQGGAPETSGVPPTLIPAIPPASSSGSPVAVAIAGPSPSPSPSPGIAGFVIVATDGQGANLRDGPSTSARVLTTLAEGTPVEILGQPVTVDGRAWQMIRGGGHEGWVVAVVVRRR